MGRHDDGPRGCGLVVGPGANLISCLSPTSCLDRCTNKHIPGTDYERLRLTKLTYLPWGDFSTLYIWIWQAATSEK